MRGSVRVVVFDVEEAGLGEGPGVVDAAGERVTGLGRGAGQGAGDLEVDSGGVVLARVELWLVTPGPAGCRGAVDDQLGVGVEVVCGGDVVGQGVGDKGCPGGQDPRDGGLGDVEQFGEELLFEVVAQAGRDEPDALVEAEPAGSGRWQVAIEFLVDAVAQVLDFRAGQSCGSVWPAVCSLIVFCHASIVSEQTAFAFSDTRPWDRVAPLRTYPMNKPLCADRGTGRRGRPLRPALLHDQDDMDQAVVSVDDVPVRMGQEIRTGEGALHPDQSHRFRVGSRPLLAQS